MPLERRIRTLERAMRARIASATDAELEAYVAQHPLDPELGAELDTWTNEQLEAAIRGVPLATVRAMQPGTTSSPPNHNRVGGRRRRKRRLSGKISATDR
jgi:hypothetical protein